jgi:hypothetical protein
MGVIECTSSFYKIFRPVFQYFKPAGSDSMYMPPGIFCSMTNFSVFQLVFCLIDIVYFIAVNPASFRQGKSEVIVCVFGGTTKYNTYR